MVSWIPRLLWVTALAFALAWIVSALIPREPPGEALRYFDSEFLSRAQSRATLSYVTSGVATLATFAVLYLFSRSSPVSGRFIGDVTGWGAAKFGLCLGVAASALLSLVRLPFSAYVGYSLEKRFGLSRMTFDNWIADYVKSSLFDLVAYGLGAAFVAWALVRLPRTWPAVVTIAFLAASILMSALYPLVIAPAFNKFHPLEDAAVLEDVRALSRAAGMEVDRVLVMEASAKTSRANAYFSGIGRTKEVVLYDTLLTSHSPGEIRLVIAHELGHWHYGHVVKGVIASTLGVFVALSLFRASTSGTNAFSTLNDFGSLKSVLVSLLVFTVLFSYVLTPVSTYISRSFEVKSDAYSTALTGDRHSFVASQVNLATSNLADVEPPPFIRWFAWTHPTTLERIGAAR